MPIMLKGQELLAKCTELRGSAKSDLVRACGYVSEKDNKEKLHFTEFYDALLEAKDGLFWGSPRVATPRTSGRKRSNIIRANVAGALIIGKAYTSQLGIEHKDEFIIRLGRSGRITLIPRDEDPAGDQDNAETEAQEPAAASAEAAATPAYVPAGMDEAPAITTVESSTAKVDLVAGPLAEPVPTGGW